MATLQICSSANEVLNLSPGDRKFLVIDPTLTPGDRKYLVIAPTHTPEGKSIATTLAKPGVVGAAALVLRLFPATMPIAVVGGLAYAGVRAHKRWKDKKKYVLPEGTVILTTANVDALTFPPSHPVVNAVYVCHPVLTSQYFPLNRYHFDVFQSKAMELVRLLRHLGARRIMIHNLEGMGVGSDLKVDVAGVVSSSATTKHERSSKMTYYAEYPQPSQPPRLPDGLHWFHREQSWYEIADSRLYHGTTKFAMNLEYVEDFGVNVEVAEMFKKINVGLSGDFSQAYKSINSVSGEFWTVSQHNAEM